MQNCRYSLGFVGGGASNDSVVVEERNFHRLSLAICSETLDSIGYRIYSSSTAFQWSSNAWPWM